MLIYTAKYRPSRITSPELLYLLGSTFGELEIVTQQALFSGIVENQWELARAAKPSLVRYDSEEDEE